MDYLAGIDDDILEYYHVLEPNFPEWLNEYINTKELLKQQYISVTCGRCYSKLHSEIRYYSSLDHSIAVALIVWHFTHDKKQTISGLLHDIATPVFKHCVDFLHGDYMKQEATEDLTTSIIESSKEIMELLKRDGIKLSEVDNYHLYPIADNDTPRLAADRLEYTLSNAMFQYGLENLEKIKEFYEDIEIQTNEDDLPELGFKTKKIAREFVKLTSKLSLSYRDEKTVFSMQFLADILKKLNADGTIKLEDLYHLKEIEIIHIIETSKYKEVFEKWKNATQINISREEPKDVYFVHHGAKIRYINPLVKGERIYDICKIAKRMIDNNLSYQMNNYTYLDFRI